MEKERAKEIVQRMGLARYTSKSVVDPKQFLKEAGRAREMGYAIDDEEYILGVKAIAAPIQGPSLPPAAIWVVGFTSTLDHKKEKVVCFEIQKTAMEINHSLKTVIHGVLNVQS